MVSGRILLESSGEERPAPRSCGDERTAPEWEWIAGGIYPDRSGLSRSPLPVPPVERFGMKGVTAPQVSVLDESPDSGNRPVVVLTGRPFPWSIVS